MKIVEIECQHIDDKIAYADADQLDFIFRNLLSNAIKFSNKNAIINIDVQKTEGNKLKVSVKDSGAGMTKETLESLFGVKQKINLGTANEKGSGLGLLLCKEFVVANNGKIWAESVAGEGSVFYFTIDAA